MHRSVKAVIFDMDGTLVNNISFHRAAWLQLLKNHAIELKPDKFNAVNHGKIDEMIKYFFGNTLSENEILLLGEEKERLYRELYKSHIAPIAGLHDFLETLSKRGVKIALATMGELPNINFILDALAIRPFFDVITGGHEVAEGKPHPEIFLTSLTKLGLESYNCIAIEDSFSGVQSAKEAGLEVVGVSSTYSKQDLLNMGCLFVVEDYKSKKIRELLA